MFSMLTLFPILKPKNLTSVLCGRRVISVIIGLVIACEFGPIGRISVFETFAFAAVASS